MRIAIIGTRGIPNHYGGFEQCAEYLAVGLVKKGHEVIVYNSHNHPYQQSEWNGVKLVHKYDPEVKIGTAGQFIYDYNCIRDLKKQNCDVILQLGYTSSSIWGWLMPKDVVVTTNMDGLEWKRAKYSNNVRKFLMYAEKLAIRFSDHLISDSIGIQSYLVEKYDSPSTYIPYGADVFDDCNPAVLTEYDLQDGEFNLLIARLEPENSIEIILDGVCKAMTNSDFLVIGNHNSTYGEYLKNKYAAQSNIRFIGGIYDIDKLNNLRYYSNLYFHGHTVGGTNPSLLEAMASRCLISANNNPFNRHILGRDAMYFDNADDVAKQLLMVEKRYPMHIQFVDNNILKIKNLYSWASITDQYEAHFLEITKQRKEEKAEEVAKTPKSSITTLILLFMSLFMFSCGAYKKTAYFQDLQGNTSESIKNYVEMTVQPQDVLDIRVSSLNADASALFNSTMVKEDDGYVVDQSGNISVPGLGYVQVSGLTTPQVREKLLKLVAPSLKQPAVSVKILNFKVSVMGDVLRPGVYPVASERITITEAISAAGDLNITAKRKNVTLIRETDGVRNYIAIDLTSKDLFNSPYYYLRNNDVIYAQPGNMKYAQASRSYEIGALVLSALSIAAIVFTTLVK